MGLPGFLKHVGTLIQLFGQLMSQKSIIKSSSVLTLKPAMKMSLSWVLLCLSMTQSRHSR